jgi:hypothetical protein
MHLHEQFMTARHEEMLRVAAQARQARATPPAIPHPAIARAITAELVPTPRRPRTGYDRHRLAALASLARRVLAPASARSLRPAR